jgi:short-subunit dehydrogenase
MNIHSKEQGNMSNTKAKTVLITGATAGIGRMTAAYLAQRGHRVIATGRKADELAKLAAEVKLDTLVLDVTSSESITNAVEAVNALTDGHGIDVLVNNAGFGVLGPTAEITDADMRRQYETNVFGLMNVTRAFLPKLIERRAGRIVNVSSVGGRITIPYFGVYNSTKYAVESLSDALRWELGAFGIDVSLIEPGVIRTNFEATAVSGLGRFKSGPYANAIDKYEQLSKSADRFAGEPIVIAKAIARAIEAKRPAARYVAPWFNAGMIFMSKIVPQRMWDWAMRKIAYLTPSALGVAERSCKSPEQSTIDIAHLATLPGSERPRPHVN